VRIAVFTTKVVFIVFIYSKSAKELGGKQKVNIKRRRYGIIR
jgi:hypothetical protein